MPGPGDLHTYAEELLAAGAEALDTIPDLLDASYAGAPTRQFVSPGVPVADCCEMLATWIDPLAGGSRTPSTLAPSMRINRPTVRLIILRCIPSGKIQGKTYVPPTPAELTAAAAQVNADGWAIWNHLFNLVNAQPESLLFARCMDLVWESALSQTPSGGCGGWRFGLSIGADGYPEDLST